MAITGEKIRRFTYIEFEEAILPFPIKDYLHMKLADVESKHIAFFDESTKIFLELSEKVNYGNTILGIHRSSTIENEYLRIVNMSKTSCLRAVRFVITKDGRLWSDNTHWTLAYLIKNGNNAKLLEIPVYIVDFRESIPVIYDKGGIVFDSLCDIKSAIASAQRIQERIELGWRPYNLSYKIAKLLEDINSTIAKEENTDGQS